MVLHTLIYMVQYNASHGSIRLLHTPPGGHDGDGLLDTVERYDPQRDTWTIVTNLSSPRCLGSLVALKGCLYAIGGYDGASVLQTLQVSLRDGSQWFTIPC